MYSNQVGQYTMYKFYCDHTEFKLEHKSKSQDVLIMGGVLIDSYNEKKLTNLIREIKGHYINPDLPIKYNIKDLLDKYLEFNSEADFNKIKNESYEWRRELFKRSKTMDYQIIIAIIQNFQFYKTRQKDIKSDLICFSFSDLLMRIGLEAKEKKFKNVQIIIDWPESNNPKPYNHSYYYGYWKGTSPDNGLYYSGPLRDIGFHESVVFALMNHSNMLQFTDIIIGAARDFLSTKLEDREYSIGKELTESILDKYRGFPNVIGRGISVSSNNTEIKKRINDLIKQYIA